MINAIKLNHFFRNDINDIDMNQIKYKDSMFFLLPGFVLARYSALPQVERSLTWTPSWLNDFWPVPKFYNAFAWNWRSLAWTLLNMNALVVERFFWENLTF